MPNITVAIPDEIFKILEWDIYEVREWLKNAVNEKARRLMDSVVEHHTTYNPKKLTMPEKIAIIGELDLETAKERTDRMEAEIK